jgi:sulfur carrier protein ThiS
VDGEDLAALIPRDTDVVVAVNPDQRPTVTITLTADRIEVVDALCTDEKDPSR